MLFAFQLPDVNLLAVSHSGVYLVRRDHAGSQQQLTVIRAVPFNELSSATAPAHPPATLQLVLRGGARVTMHALRASPAQQMIAAFCAEYRKVSDPFGFAHSITIYTYTRGWSDKYLSSALPSKLQEYYINQDQDPNSNSYRTLQTECTLAHNGTIDVYSM